MRFDYDGGLTNCSIIHIEDYITGIFKNCTYNFCNEMGITCASATEPLKVSLWRFDTKSLQDELKPYPIEIILDGKKVDRNSVFIEDVRLCTYKNKIIGVGSIDGFGSSSWPIIGFIEGAIYKCRRIAGVNVGSPQKNWLPFVHKDNVYVVSSINPHSILAIDPFSGVASKVYESYKALLPEGCVLRGGAVIGLHNGQHLAIGHVTQNQRYNKQYYSFFYSFDDKPPFHIRKLSNYYKFIYPNQRIQYGIGGTLSDDSLVLSYGVNDCDNAFLTLRLRDVISSLKDC